MFKTDLKFSFVTRDRRIQMLLKSNLEKKDCMVDQAYDDKSSFLKTRQFDYSPVTLVADNSLSG
ncbi:hypothetical protein DMN77_09265 [Paenibacillus sp. 79R4]|nr:hypothetical protein [Paenibacillus sp. 79R4]